ALRRERPPRRRLREHGRRRRDRHPDPRSPLHPRPAQHRIRHPPELLTPVRAEEVATTAERPRPAPEPWAPVIDQTSSKSAEYSTVMPRLTLWLAGQPFSWTPSARSASARLPLGILHV